MQMASFRADPIALPPNTHHETAQTQAVQTENFITNQESVITPPIELTPNNSSSSSDGNEKLVLDGTKYGPMRGAASQDDNELERTMSQMYGPMTPDERAELRDIASLHRTKTSATSATGLERKDTLANVDDDDPRLDPEQPEFDIYIWARAFMRAMDEGGIKSSRAGFTFKDLNVSGSGSALSLQKSVGSVLMAPFRLGEYVSFGHKPHKSIIRNFDGVVKSGEMLVVLGRPGSGCSTFLKTMCGEMTGLNKEKGSVVHYNGIRQERMVQEFRGEIVYNQEVDKHFPHLTVGQTLEFAAAARTPHSRVREISRSTYIKHMTKVVMTVFGLSHTRNTKVGNEYIRGVSGGERKRVSIAEMALAGSPISCWDNSTRGLDAATALEFIRSIRVVSNVSGMCNAVAIYQASQAIFDIFDKAIVLYEGKEIFFGPIGVARQYFVNMGWFCPRRQTTGDFLTSVTNPQERKPREGYGGKVPRTSDEFEAYWRRSKEYATLMDEIREHESDVGDMALNDLRESHRDRQAKHVRPKSSYVISIPMQVKLCTIRAYQRIMGDKVSTLTTIIGQITMALIVGSIFYGSPNTTSSFFAKGAVLFFAILLNALISITEINGLYDQRPIVEKHASYAFYHPWTEAMAGVVSDIPVKLVIAVCFNIILYFLAGLRTEPSQFFIFFLFVFVVMLTMSYIFRCLAVLTTTLSQALTFAGVMVLAICIYTGFTIPRPYEHPWMKWISWINPVAYAYEGVLVNEVHGRNFSCSTLIPPPPFQSGSSFICSVVGAVAGQTEVLGDDWVQSSYQYSYSHIWRNLGFMFAFQIFFLCVYLIATELNSSASSSAEVLVFRRGHVPKHISEEASKRDEEAGAEKQISTESNGDQGNVAKAEINAILPQKGIFTWRDIVYDITIKGEPRRLLDHVSGWVKPGQLTALMGVSGAGKTTLLDALAQRTSIGVITGDMLVNGEPLDSSFQRKTGYVQQQDLHLETTTVREALRFSAMLRQPNSISKTEKYESVEEVIDMLNMRDFSEAVVGVPGEGLNVEQRKLLTIGVELAAKPALLLFLDEPTSGLDSQSSWAIVAFLRKLADHGQAVLSTIHQPSSTLFQEFDRLLFLAQGGKTVYFGDIGRNSETLLNFFESNGARHCGEEENPAEIMLEIVGAGANKATKDWHEVWRQSDNAKGIQTELDRIHREKANKVEDGDSKEAHSEFAMPFMTQLWYVTMRVFQQYWRTPSYIWAKLLLGTMSVLFIGFSFYKQNSSQQGLQNIIFSIFMLTSIFATLVQQIMPRFITQRSLYEVRERPSKAYSWAAFIIANVGVEIPWQILLGVLVFGSYYYPIFGDHQVSERQGLILLYCMQYFIFASTFAHMLIAALPDAETAGSIATVLFSLTLVFNGVMRTPQELPGFWIFMYRISPLTYLVSGIASTGMHARPVVCASNELSRFPPPQGQTCGAYLAPYLATNPGGNLINSASTSMCEYCSLSTSDQFLATLSIEYSTRWRNYGLGFSYIVFNIVMAVLLYYVFRVRKWSAASIKKGPSLKRAGFWVRAFFVGHMRPIPEQGTKEPNQNRIY